MVVCLKPVPTHLAWWTGQRRMFFPLLRPSVGRPVVLIDAPPLKRNLLRWIIISPNGTVKIKSGNQRLPCLNAAVSEGSVVQRWHPKQFACCIYTHPPRWSPGPDLFVSYRRQNPWQPIACFGGENTEGTSKHHQGDKTCRDSCCRYCNMFVMNGEFIRFSSPVVCLQCRNLG